MRAATVVVITLFIAPHGNCLAVDFLVLHGINDKVGLCLRHFHGGVLVVNVDLAEFVASHARRLDQRTQDKVGRHPVLASGVDVYPNGFRSGTLALADRLWHIECGQVLGGCVQLFLHQRRQQLFRRRCLCQQFLRQRQCLFR